MTTQHVFGIQHHDYMALPQTLSDDEPPANVSREPETSIYGAVLGEDMSTCSSLTITVAVPALEGAAEATDSGLNSSEQITHATAIPVAAAASSPRKS